MSRWPNKYVIGLTGNIAVGKSVVRQMLQHAGAYTIDADSLSHQAMLPGAPAYKPVVDAFGSFIVGSDGRINRAALGNIVFTNQQAMQKLEAIVHPVVRQAVNALVTRSKQPIVVIEAIKLLESDLAQMVDEVWVVNAKPQTQYKRLVVKRKMSQEDAKKRILAQNPQADKLKAADVVIQNDDNIEETWKQVQRHFGNVKKKLAPPAPAQPEKAKPAAQAPATPQQQAPATPAQKAPTQQAPTSTPGDVAVAPGSPNNAQEIANFITKISGSDTSRMDVMMNFGQKSYLLAQKDGNPDILAIIGWTVENLVTRCDEFYVADGISLSGVVHAIVTAVEERSKELQSEVSFIFLPKTTPSDMLRAFSADGYEPITLAEIKVPVWREAVEEALSQSERLVLWKQLRKDRVLQPI